MEKSFRNPVLEDEVKKIIAKTNYGHYNWTSRQDYHYYDEFTLFLALSQEFNDGTNEKKYSILYIINPAGIRSIYNELFFEENLNFENLNLFINRILSVDKIDNHFEIKVKSVSGIEKKIIF